VPFSQSVLQENDSPAVYGRWQCKVEATVCSVEAAMGPRRLATTGRHSSHRSKQKSFVSTLPRGVLVDVSDDRVMVLSLAPLAIDAGKLEGLRGQIGGAYYDRHGPCWDLRTDLHAEHYPNLCAPSISFSLSLPPTHEQVE